VASKEEDRAEGRSILRTFRNKDASHEKPGDVELDLEGRQADYGPFTQPDWIEKCFGNWENFMRSYGLRPYDFNDIKEAESIANAMTAYDEQKIS